MKLFFYLLLSFLIPIPLAGMEKSTKRKIVMVQVAHDKPFPISKNVFNKSGLGKALLSINPDKPIYTIPQIQIIDRKALNTEDLVIVLKAIQDPKCIDTINSKGLEHIFFVADYMCAPKQVLKTLANRYINFIGFKQAQQIEKCKKDIIMRWASLNHIKDIIHTIKKSGAREAYLQNNELKWIDDFELLGDKLNLNNLKSINLNNNNLTQSYLTHIFAACPKIESIDLSDNYINTIKADEVKKFPTQFDHLYLTHNQLTEFPIPKIKLFGNRCTIDLQGNYLSAKEVRRIKQILQVRKNAGVFAYLTTLFFIIKAGFTGNIISKNAEWLQILCICFAVYDFIDAFVQDVREYKLTILTDNQRTQD